VQLPASGFGRWENLLAKGEPVAGLVREFPDSEQKFLQPYHVISMVVVPIFVDQQWWGFIGLDECQSEREWTGNEVDALRVLANLFGTAETRTRSEQKLLRRQHTLTMLHEIVILSLKGSNLQSMSQELVDKIGELMKADGCFISLWDESYQQVIPLAAFKNDKIQLCKAISFSRTFQPSL
jgi:GAF domain-containing protein